MYYMCTGEGHISQEAQAQLRVKSVMCACPWYTSVFVIMSVCVLEALIRPLLCTQPGRTAGLTGGCRLLVDPLLPAMGGPGRMLTLATRSCQPALRRSGQW